MKLENALEKLPELLKKDLNDNLCVCNEVAKITVIEAIAEGASTLEDVRRSTYASDGNGCCKRQVLRLLEYLVDEEF